MADRHDNIVKLRNENRDLEEKLRETLNSTQHRGDVIKQLRDEIKQYQNRVSVWYMVIAMKLISAASKQNSPVYTLKLLMFKESNINCI